MDKYDALNENYDNLTKELEKKQQSRKNKKIKEKEDLHDLYDSIEQKSNHTFSKLEDLNRKASIVISVGKILPQIPENFPKNYNVQFVYEDVTITGNQKFVDFDENIIDEKMVLPLLNSEKVRFQLWVAEQQPSLFDKGTIYLENDIKQALEKSICEGEVNFDSNKLSVTYTLQIQGIGFKAWLKNIGVTKQVEEQRKKSKKETESKRENAKQKVREKKMKFANTFQQTNRKTQEYQVDQLDKIIETLQD